MSLPLPESRAWPLRLRNAVIPDALGRGWMPFAMLGYLVFLFLPALMRLFPGIGIEGMPFDLPVTLLSIALFLPLYFAFYRLQGAVRLACVAGIFVLGLAVLPWNAYGNTYVIYAASLLGVLRFGLWMRVLLVSAMLALFAAVLYRLWPQPMAVFVAGITALIAFSAFLSLHFQSEAERKRAALKLSHEEVRRVAAFAERERIGRDLHDLLGHTLSLVALKAELAGKLALRDAAAAKQEIDEVAGIAREALAQVRTAVSGIRSALIAAEVASAKVLLEAAGIRLQADIEAVPMSQALESALAMTLREAATNIERHAQAAEAQVTLRRMGDAVELRVVDDGRGGTITPGNGIDGMCRRIAELGGAVQFEPCARGTRLCVSVPLERPA